MSQCPQVSPHLLRVQCHPEPDGGPVIHCVLGHQRRPPAQGHGLEHVPDGHLSVGLGSEVMGSHRGQWSHRGHMSLTATLALAWGQRSHRGQTEVMGSHRGQKLHRGHMSLTATSTLAWGQTSQRGHGVTQGSQGHTGVPVGIWGFPEGFFVTLRYISLSRYILPACAPCRLFLGFLGSLKYLWCPPVLSLTCTCPM